MFTEFDFNRKATSYLTIALLTSLFICFSANTRAQGFLRADGGRIVNDKGDNMLLRGIGLGGWMLQEGYMLGLQSQGQQHKIKGRIATLIGDADTEIFYNAWLANHTRRIDIDSLKAWGFNSVRLPMHFNLYTLPVEAEPENGKQTWLEKGFQMTDSLLAWCKSNQVYLILDLHAAPGGQGNDFNISDRDPATPSLWESRANQEKTIALWRKLAERYSNEPWIAAYDILNEPNYGFENPDSDKNGLKEQKNEPLKNLYTEITKAIREVDQKHIIVIEGNGWGNNYNGMLPLWDKNIVVSFHKYWNSTAESSIGHMIAMRNTNQVPVWLGETGENSNVWFRSCINTLERNNIGWAMWPLKKLGANNPLQIRSNPDYDAVLSYWRGQGTQPSRDVALRGLMRLAEDVKLENNIYHRDVVDAMMRQPHSDVTLPFKNHRDTIYAVDYDLGKINRAYYDLDSANYRVDQGQQGGNKGRTYRNDGVDIREDEHERGTFYVDNTEPGEWLNYTVTRKTAGKYQLILEYNVPDTGAQVSIQINNEIPQTLTLKPGYSGKSWNTSSSTKLPLKAGKNTIRVTFLDNGISLKKIMLKR